MPLTDAQRRQIKDIIRPLLSETLSESVGRAVEAELRKMTSSETDYAQRVLGGTRSSSPPRRNAELPAAGRLFARLALVTAGSGGDRATALDLATALDIEDEYKSVVKAAQSASSAEPGGILVLGDTATEIIELLRARTVMRRLSGAVRDAPAGQHDHTADHGRCLQRLRR